MTATGSSIAEARDRAYRAVDMVAFDGARCRRDIAAVAGA